MRKWILIFALVLFSTNAYAYDCAEGKEIECLHKYALDLYPEAKDKNYPYKISAQSLLAFEALNEFEHSMDSNLYFEGLDQNDRVTPLSLYHVYHLYNTSQLGKVLDYLTQTKP